MRQRGFRVILADGATPPIDKPCGEGVMPEGIHALQRLGVRVQAEDAYPLRGIRFSRTTTRIDAEFPAGECGLGIRRTTLHRLMTERAVEAGVELLWGTVVTGISADGVRLGNRVIEARWIIGADGGNSRVRRWADLDTHLRREIRYAFLRHYQVAPWTDRVEIHWGPHSQVYVTPVTDEQVGVALISRDPKLRLENALVELPQLEDRLRSAELASPEKGALSATRILKRVCRGNVALIGDASGMVDAITGEGLSLSFRQALALADCLVSGNLARYRREHRRLAIRPLLMARLMLALDGRAKLQQRTFEVFRRRPEMFQRLLSLHVGAASLFRLALDGLTLGWGLLAA
jgi:flavin-dependent dehydrogenase